MIESMGHTPQIEDPDLFVSLVEEWIDAAVLQEAH
jgi:hypothetical protein